MNIEQKIIYQNIEYRILAAEQEFIVHPVAFGLLPYTSASIQCSYSCLLHLKDYRLLLSRLELGTSEALNLGGARIEGYSQIHEFNEQPVYYNGTIVIGTNLVKEYYLNGSTPSIFSYQKVIELVFEKGVLVTTIDQSKAMLRIRKNLELGLRKLSSSRDARCISRFMNSAFIGDYKPFRFHYNRMKYVKEMKQDYSNTALV
jgi:hypothetical protein